MRRLSVDKSGFLLYGRLCYNEGMDKPNWKPIKVKLGNIIDWDRNPKASTKKTSERLNDSLDTLGDFQTLAVSPFIDGGVMVHNYDGHSRRNSWMQGKGADFEVHALQSDRMLTEKEREKLAIVGHVATGNIDWNEVSGWDVGELQKWGMDEAQLDGWNLDATNLKEMLAAEGGIEFKEYDESVAEGVSVCVCPVCGNEHAKTD